jgi:FkbM family methyltransferase
MAPHTMRSRPVTPAAVARRALWEVLHRLPPRALTVRTRHGVLSIGNKDRAIGRLLFTWREFELDTIARAIRCAVRAGALAERNDGWLLDVGANVGSVCIPLVRRGVFTRAVAFEPEPENYGHLRRSLSLNGIGTGVIRPVNAALSSVNGAATLELAFTNSGDHRIRVEAPRSSHPDCREDERVLIEVPVHRLDDVVASLRIAREQVKLLWIDVQGHEAQVMEGAPALLAAGVPVVTEFWPYGLQRSGASGRNVAELLRATFTTFHDLSEDSPTPRPIAEIDSLFTRYAGTSFTDLLLLSRPR